MPWYLITHCIAPVAFVPVARSFVPVARFGLNVRLNELQIMPIDAVSLPLSDPDAGLRFSWCLDP
jgi:hypothetical protein